MDDTLKIINELEEIETTKQTFEEQLAAITSNYFDSGQVTFLIHDDSYDDTEEDIELAQSITVDYDTGLMVEYIKSEIVTLTRQSNGLINRLSE